MSWPVRPGRGGSVIILENLIRGFTPDEVVLLGELALCGRPVERDPKRPQTYYFRSGFSLFGRGARFFAWFRWLLFPLLVRKICRVARREQCDYILGIYPDDYYCFAAVTAAKRLGLRFSSYFHNTYLDNAAADHRRAVKIQPEIFARSEVVFVMNDGMKTYYESKYGLRNAVSLVHTFQDFPPLSPLPDPPLAERDTIRLVLFGNFNQSNIEATQRFIAAVSADPRCSVFVYTHVPIPLLKLRGIDTDAITHMGYIDDADLLDELQQYDIMVLTHGFQGGYGEVEYRTIFPTRTIPMLLSGRPILMHSPPDAFLSDFARQHGCACLVDEPSEEAVRAGLERIVTDANYAQELIDRARKTAELFHGPRVIRGMREALGMTTSQPGRSDE